MTGTGKGRKNYNWLILLIILIAIAGLILMVQKFLKQDELEEEMLLNQISPVQEMLQMDFETSYPLTPREVARSHAELSQVLYNETYTEEEFDLLAQKALELYDEEFANNKELEVYLDDLATEITVYHNNGWSIADFELSTTDEVVYTTQEGDELAQLFCTYTIAENTGKSQIIQSILLRKDEEGHYKIMGWKLALDDD